MSIKILQGILQ